MLIGKARHKQSWEECRRDLLRLIFILNFVYVCVSACGCMHMRTAVRFPVAGVTGAYRPGLSARN